MPNLLATRRGRRILFTALYVSEGAPIGFLWWALPTKLRAAGVGVDAITAITSLLVLPWVFKFLWSPLIDGIRTSRWSLRSWILSAQIALGLLLLPLLLWDQSTDTTILVPFLFLSTVAAATQDAAIDALAIASVPGGERGSINGWMQMGMLVGRSALGGGALLLDTHIGFAPVVLVLIAVVLSTSILVFMARESPRPESPETPLRARLLVLLPRLGAAFRRRTTWLGLLFAAIAGAGFEAVGAVAGPMLIDTGYAQSDVGAFFAFPSVMAMAVGALVGGAVADRLGPRRAAGVFLALLSVSILGVAGFLEAAYPGPHTVLLVLLTLFYGCIGMFTASSYALFMELTDPELGATQFSAFMGATNGCESWASFAAGRLVPVLGYPPAFLLITAASLAAYPLLRKMEKGMLVGEKRGIHTLLVLLALVSAVAHARTEDSTLVIHSPDAVRVQLLADEDTDGDLRITVVDPPVTGTERGDRVFWFRSGTNPLVEVRGTYRLAVLLEELTLHAGDSIAALSPDRIYTEKPADRLARTIRERLWDGLTRRIDEQGLPAMMRDEKIHTAGDSLFLYVPHGDTASLRYYTDIISRHPEWRARTIRLPRQVDASAVRSIGHRHGLLVLGLDPTSGSPRPFVVPGGRFNEMYGWDSYFIILGLAQSGRWDLARSMIDNMVYEIRHYGKILNANRTYYLTRSQPPFLTSMLRAVLPGLPRHAATGQWARGVLEAAIEEYERVWTGHLRLTPTGLSRYYGEGTGVPPEVEPGHFAPLFAEAARSLGMPADSLEQQYTSGRYESSVLDTFFVHDRAMRESGHDTSYRLYGLCARLATVDLNSLLYAYERDIAALIEKLAAGRLLRADGREERSQTWTDRAARRRELMFRYLWDPAQQLFVDYDIQEGKRTGYVSATTLYPLWAGILTQDESSRLLRVALPLLEMPGGIAGSTERSRGPLGPERPARQWDFPYGWSPHQMLVWDGLMRYGHAGEARRLAYRWLYTIVANAAFYQGTIPEKFDVVKRSHRVFAEYGNVGTTFSYITREGFGWTNASVLVGLSLLTPRQRELLNDLVPPEAVGTW